MKDGTTAETAEGGGGGHAEDRQKWSWTFSKIVDVDNIDAVMIEGERFPV